MVWVQRDARGKLSGVSLEEMPGFTEQLPDDDAEVLAFVADLDQSGLARSDLDFVRVLEDLLEVLIRKNLLLFTELPEQAQQKILQRRALRRGSEALDLVDDDLQL
ncbi:MAG: tryptophan synthase subunit beta like protein [Pseudomonadota bacterium]